jgi:hypothetical protein
MGIYDYVYLFIFVVKYFLSESVCLKPNAFNLNISVC